MTQTSKHTPGPWRIRKGGNIGNMIEGQSGLKAHPFDDGWRGVALFQCCCASPLATEQEANAIANARLIAAAPDMLGFCQRVAATKPVMATEAELLKRWLAMITEAKAVIARATSGEG